MTTDEMVRACLQTAATAFGSVFVVLAVFYLLIRLLSRTEAAVADAAGSDGKKP